MQADLGSVAKREHRQVFDGWLFGSALLLIVVGLLAINSIDAATGLHNAARQGVFAALGVGVWYFWRKVPLEFWQRATKVIYVVNLALLAAVLLTGHSAKGADRWLSIGPLQFQPGDLAKILVVLTLASFFATRQEELKEKKTLLLSFLHVLPSVVLLLLQPHYGGAACIIAIWLTVALYAGVPWQNLGAALACMLALFGVALVTPGLMHGYHMNRLENFVNKIFHGTSDTQGAGWQAAQSVKAIAIGGITGSGYGKGEQKAGKFIPEQHNDFVFSVIGEELGLIGSLMVLTLFLLFFYRVWDAGFKAREPMGRMVAGGILGVLAFHTVVNLSMVLNIGPVIGLWLPFVSYGGTALWTCMAMVGLVGQVT